VSLEYQCKGADYDRFAQALLNFSNHHSCNTWGRRPTIMPDHTNVVFLGNSHTKQTTMELVCQYSDQLVKLIELKNKDSSHAQEFVFRNNASVVLVYNSPVDIAIDWVSELERLTKRSLSSSFSAIVLGQFNVMNENTINTSYYKQMLAWAATNKNLQAGRDPPDVVQVAQKFAGPIVFLSSFSGGLNATAPKAFHDIQQIQRATNRTNMEAIYARKYIDLIDPGNECISLSRMGTSECMRATNLGAHRCVGLEGGYPTLTAHDVQEALYKLLSKTESTKHLLT
jgi:hypothetical protein